MDKDLILKKIESLTLLHKALIVVGSLIVLGGVYWFFWLSPDLDRMAYLRNDVTRLDQEIAANRAKIKILPELEAELFRREAEFVWAKTLLPEDTQALEGLLASFEILGRDEGVEFQSFQPGAEVMHDFYATRSVKLVLRGSFHNLMRYFDRLARVDRLVRLESIKLTPGQGKDGGVSVELGADCQLSVYRALTSKELEAKAQPVKGKK
ncbi:MAG: hypothetical protein EOM25_10285 [Deltaproteobacteria bacterium]|nr:hypothetical protein [Deltaproteobacteria bacterium]